MSHWADTVKNNDTVRTCYIRNGFVLESSGIMWITRVIRHHLKSALQKSSFFAGLLQLVL